MMMTGVAAISTHDLRQADGLISDIAREHTLRKAADPDVERYQHLYARALRHALQGRIEVLTSRDFQGDLVELLSEADDMLGPDLASELEPSTRRYLTRAFQTGQALRGISRAVQTVFDTPRKGAVDWLVYHDRFWLGKVFPQHVSGVFRDTIVQGLEDGLGRKAIGARLRNLMLGTKDVPGKLDFYTRVVAANITRAHNWGGMFSLEDAGIDEYVFRAVMDERTSSVCRAFNKRVFSVARVMNTVRGTLSHPPDALESLAPWPTHDKTRDDFYIERGGARTYLKTQSSTWLADNGVSLPPLHGHCRSVITVNR